MNTCISYIYALQDPQDHRIRYIGCSDSPVSRFTTHVHINTRKPENKKDEWILSLRKSGLKPKLIILDSCHHEYRCDLELHYFNLHKDVLYQDTPAKKKVKPFDQIQRLPSEVDKLNHKIAFPGFKRKRGQTDKWFTAHKINFPFRLT